MLEHMLQLVLQRRGAAACAAACALACATACAAAPPRCSMCCSICCSTCCSTLCCSVCCRTHTKYKFKKTSKQMPFLLSDFSNEERMKRGHIKKGRAMFFSFFCSQVRLRELPPPAVASPASGRPPVACAWRDYCSLHISLRSVLRSHKRPSASRS